MRRTLFLLSLVPVAVWNATIAGAQIKAPARATAPVVAVATALAQATHNTCGLIAQVPGGEVAAEALALASLNTKLPMSFSDKVTVGHVPVTNDPIKVKVEATVKKPAKNVNIVCATSSISSSLDIKVRVSGRAGSSTHNGDARIKGSYTVSLSPIRVCVRNLKLSDLNLHNVQNNVDDWIRKKINQSGLVSDFCVP